MPVIDHMRALERMEELRDEARRERVARLAHRGEPDGPPTSLRSPGRRLAAEAAALAVPVAGFGALYGVTARHAELSFAELTAMNALVFAGGSQLLAVGLLVAGLPWIWIVAATAVVNARHLPYAVTLAPWLADRPLLMRAFAAYVVVDETFTLTMAHIRRIGHFDGRAYALVALMLASSWFASSSLGWWSTAVVPPRIELLLAVLGPAAIAGMAVLLVEDRATLAATIWAVPLAIGVGSLLGSAAGVATGALLGALLAAKVPAAPPGPDRERGQAASRSGLPAMEGPRRGGRTATSRASSGRIR